MRILLVVLTSGLLLVAGSGFAQPLGLQKGEVCKPAPSVVPDVHLARAVEQDGEVSIWLTSRALRLKEKAPTDKNPPTGMYCWEERKRPLTLGKQVQAYGVSGKVMDKEAVLKALTRPTAVCCSSTLPDPIYTGMFRDDVVVLVMNWSLDQK